MLIASELSRSLTPQTFKVQERRIILLQTKVLGVQNSVTVKGKVILVIQNAVMGKQNQQHTGDC